MIGIEEDLVIMTVDKKEDLPEALDRRVFYYVKDSGDLLFWRDGEWKELIDSKFVAGFRFRGLVDASMIMQDWAIGTVLLVDKEGDFQDTWKDIAYDEKLEPLRKGEFIFKMPNMLWERMSLFSVFCTVERAGLIEAKNVEQDERIGTAETDVENLESAMILAKLEIDTNKLDSETRDSVLGERATNLEAKDVVHETRMLAIEEDVTELQSGKMNTSMTNIDATGLARLDLKADKTYVDEQNSLLRVASGYISEAPNGV